LDEREAGSAAEQVLFVVPRVVDECFEAISFENFVFSLEVKEPSRGDTYKQRFVEIGRRRGIPIW
jgi:hypothetical protein